MAFDSLNGIVLSGFMTLEERLAAMRMVQLREDLDAGQRGLWFIIEGCVNEQKPQFRYPKMGVLCQLSGRDERWVRKTRNVLRERGLCDWRVEVVEGVPRTAYFDLYPRQISVEVQEDFGVIPY